MENSLKQKVTNLVLDKMLELAGYNVTYERYSQLTHQQQQQYTISQKTMEYWANWAANAFQQNLNYDRTSAEVEVSWIQYSFGLNIKNL